MVHSRRNRRGAVAVVLAGWLALSAPRVLSSEVPVAPAERTAVVTAIGEQLSALYVDPAIAERAVAVLQGLQAGGELDALADPEELAVRLTRELRRATGDLHVEVRVRPSPSAAGAAVGPADWREPLRRRGYDFRRVEWLMGGVGYLDLRSFPPLDVARSAADAAMGLLSGADAVVLDLRRNSGGTGEMVELLVSWFLPPQTLLATTFKRSRNETRESWTRSDVAETALRDVPLYLLTSGSTFSAAEALAYELQARQRAVVVGESTRGGANPGGWEPAGERFEVFVPDVLVRSAATGSNWEGTGVTPDVPVAAAEALIVAHRAALVRLATTAQPDRRRELEWAVAVLDAASGGALPSGALAALAGLYGEHEVTGDGTGGLQVRQNRGLWSRLLALDGGSFALEGVDGVRLRFELDASGAAETLLFEWANGEVRRHARAVRSRPPRHVFLERLAVDATARLPGPPRQALDSIEHLVRDGDRRFHTRSMTQ